MRIHSLVLLVGLALVDVTSTRSSVYAYDHSRDFRADDVETWPVIAIIIDDMGYGANDGARVVALPGPVACAVLPYTPHAHQLAERAHKAGKEVMLHLPLEAAENNQLLGSGALKLDDTATQFQETLHANLAAIPHVEGINNHMGSLLTRHPGHMRWLMQAMKDSGELFFVDSRTTKQSVALNMAHEYAVPAVKRDVFLDGEKTLDAVAYQFSRLKQLARKNGYAVAIGHPYSETMQVLEQELPRLDNAGFRLVSVKEMIAIQQRKVSASPARVAAMPVTDPK